MCIRDSSSAAAKKHEEEERSAVVRDVRSSRIFEEDFDPLAGAAAAAAAATAAVVVSPSSGGGGSSSSKGNNMRNPHVSMSKSCTSNSIADLGKENRANNGGSSNAKESRGGGEWKRRSMPAKSGGTATEEDPQGNKAIQVSCLETNIHISQLSRLDFI